MNQEPEKIEQNNVESNNDRDAVTPEKADGENAGYKLARSAYDFVEMFSIAFIAVLLILTFCVRLCTVDGRSMNNTLKDGELLITSDLFYTPRQGDIVVFHLSNEYYQQPLVKRVIATEGQDVLIDLTDGKVYVDGEELSESYAYLETGAYQPHGYFDPDLLKKDPRGHLIYAVTVPEGKLFVMGDNRNHSSDSRSAKVSFVDEDTILGKMIFRLTSSPAIKKQ